MEGVAERYFRTWERDGRRQLDAKLALRFSDYDEQRSGRLQHLEWDTHHCTYDEEYTFTTVDAEGQGAWTLDCDRTTLQALRERGIDVPDPEAIPIAVDAHQARVDTVDRECRACRTDAICSAREVEYVYPAPSRDTAMDAVIEAEAATHLCTHCRRFFHFETRDRVEEQPHARDIAADLSEAM